MSPHFDVVDQQAFLYIFSFYKNLGVCQNGPLEGLTILRNFQVQSFLREPVLPVCFNGNQTNTNFIFGFQIPILTSYPLLIARVYPSANLVNLVRPRSSSRRPLGRTLANRKPDGSKSGIVKTIWVVAFEGFSKILLGGFPLGGFSLHTQVFNQLEGHLRMSL